RAVPAARRRNAGRRFGGPGSRPPRVHRLQARQRAGRAGRHASVEPDAVNRHRGGRGHQEPVVAPLAVAVALKGTAAVVAALAAGGALLLPSPRVRAASAFAALVLAPVLLLGELWGSSQI